MRRELGDTFALGQVANNHEGPRLAIRPAAGPTRDLQDRLDRGVVDRLVGELADLPGPAKGPENPKG
jgi:hypothetical protein